MSSNQIGCAVALIVGACASLACMTLPAQAASKSGAERAVERHLERTYGVEAEATCDRSRYLRKYTCIWNAPLQLVGATNSVCSREGSARVTWPAGRYRVSRYAETKDCVR